MSSTGIGSGYLYRCAERAESFSVLSWSDASGGSSGILLLIGLRNAITYR